MVKLDSIYRQLASFHLYGTRAGVPVGDLAAFEEACATIPDETAAAKVRDLIGRVEKAWNDLSTAQQAIATRTETYGGDINRAVVRAERSRQVVEFYYDVYYRHVDMLARMLNVPEYTTPNSDTYRYARHGGEYVKSLPGAAGNSDSLFTALRFA
jgi:hypothetical protein